MGALLDLIPTKDWFLGAFIALLAVLCWHFYDKYEDAVNYRMTVQAESKAALDAAQQAIKDNEASYQAARNQENAHYEQALSDAAHQHDDDVARLRAATARQTNAALDSTAAPTAGSATGTGGPASLSGLSEQAVVCQGLSDALAHDNAVLAKERAERDSITGK